MHPDVILQARAIGVTNWTIVWIECHGSIESKGPRGRHAARSLRKTVPLLAKFRRRSINENEPCLFRASAARATRFLRLALRTEPAPLGFVLSGTLQRETEMDKQTKHEIVVIALSTLAAVPVLSGLGFVVVSGIVAW
jgi:hypothetical protein